MKIWIPTTILCFLISLSSYAQIKIGVKGGLTISSEISEYENSARAGFHLGGFANFGISDNVGIQTELIFTTAGGVATVPSGVQGINLKLTDKMSYLQIPVLLKYHANSGFTLEAGPYFGFLLSAKSSSEYEPPQGANPDDVDFKENANSVEFGLAGGLGYELASGLSFNGRLMYGISGILNSDFVDQNDIDSNFNNFIIQISVGFPLYAN